LASAEVGLEPNRSREEQEEDGVTEAERDHEDLDPFG